MGDAHVIQGNLTESRKCYHKALKFSDDKVNFQGRQALPGKEIFNLRFWIFNNKILSIIIVSLRSLSLAHKRWWTIEAVESDREARSLSKPKNQQALYISSN